MKGMKALLLCAALFGGASARSIPRSMTIPPTPLSEGDHWAVLIAGSAGWGNYRHQADIAHSYQLLIKAGISADKIITLMADDVANNEQNPHPGTLINQPGGEDVYKNIKIDYKGTDVTAATMLSVIGGNAKDLEGVGSGKVLASSKDSHVFIYFADHGGPGILGTPVPPYLMANDLITTLKSLNTRKMYKQLTFYVEACESGSIFDGLLPEDINIYVTTAANPTESSWGYYCPGMTPAPPSEYNTCLGDLYSISFLENSDAEDLSIETLTKQYGAIKQRTSQNGTYNQGSHVMQYGDVSIASEHVDVFVGTGSESKSKGMMGMTGPVKVPAGDFVAVEQRHADLMPLKVAVNRAVEGSQEHKEATAALDAEVAQRTAVEKAVWMAVGAAATAAGSNDLVDTIMTEAPAAGKPVTTDWACYKESMNVWARACGAHLPQYALKHARGFANLCSRGVPASALEVHAATACGKYSVARA